VIAAQIIPFTFAHTALSESRVGDAVNLEVDVLGKYVVRLLESRLREGAAADLLPVRP
jgi:riboflavin synthase